MPKFTVTSKSIPWGNQTLTLETGQIARQADGSVLVRCGDNVILCTVVAQRQPMEDCDFFPLTVNYQEKFSAAGRIPGGYLKREGRPSEKETLISRLIDRPLRPLFHNEFRNETQIICTVLSYDGEQNTDVLSLIGASAAVSLAGLPFHGPLGSHRVGYIDSQYVLNPSPKQMEKSKMDLVIAGNKEGILMVESYAKELSEKDMLGAISFAHENFSPILEMITDLTKEAGKPRWDNPVAPEYKAKILEHLQEYKTDLLNAYKNIEKSTRKTSIKTVFESVCEKLQQDFTQKQIQESFHDFEKQLVRKYYLENKTRLDGRTSTDIRSIDCQTSLLPRSHGSALFTRGETQALVTTTLGSSADQQMTDNLDGETKESFMLHYNFPPYSVGEVRRMMGVSRREVGHGKLAWKAIQPILPPVSEEFPFTLRLISDVTESNGSSSMATVCGASLSLMDAGIQIKEHISGIAMGLIQDNKETMILSDILGDEDHLGDMDFKVAGTSKGITALQMDIKVMGVTHKIMANAIEQAQKGRLWIQEQMIKGIEKPKKTISPYAPSITVIQIKKEKIKDLIGTGGKNIREICDKTQSKIDIEDTGKVTISSQNKSILEKTLEMIKTLTREPEVGAIYNGEVVKIMDFGAFVNIYEGCDGLVHISEVSTKRINTVEEHLKVGDQVHVLLTNIDQRGKIKLSMKRVDQKTGKQI